MATNRPIEIEELYGQLSSGDDDWHWFVVYTKPRREKKLADYARQNNVSYYLPLLVSERLYKYRKVTFTKPLFPGYIFILCNLLEKRSLILSGHIVKFLKVSNEKQFLTELNQIYSGKVKGAVLKKTDYIPVGIPVRIKNGTFSGLTGVVKDAKNANKVILKVSLLREAVSIEINKDQIEILKEH